MEHVERALEVIKTPIAQDMGQDRLFTIKQCVLQPIYIRAMFYIISNNFSLVAVITPQRLTSILTDKIVMALHRQVISLKILLLLAALVQGAA